MADTDGSASVDQTTQTTEETRTETGETGEQQPERTFTQADLDRIVKDRLARQAGQFKGYDELKKKAEEFDRLQESQKSELEKAVARAEQAEKERVEIELRARDAMLRASVVAEAAKPGRRIADPDITYTFLTGPDRDLLDVDDDGNPTDIAKAMDQLLERRSYLVAPAGGARAGSADQGARKGGANQIAADDLKSMSAEEIVRARKEGRLHSLGVSS